MSKLRRFRAPTYLFIGRDLARSVARLRADSFAGIAVQSTPELSKIEWAGVDFLVLGDAAISQLSAGETLDLIQVHRVQAFVCPSRVTLRECLPWFQRPLVSAVSPAELLQVLYQARLACSWLALDSQHLVNRSLSELSEEQTGMILALERLPRKSTAGWARHLGLSRHALRRRCLRAFGLAPDALVSRWTTLAFEELRSRGATWEEVARALGYSSGSSARRAARASQATQAHRSRA